MSYQKLTRQSLCMVLSRTHGLLSLGRLDVSRLFYPSREEAIAAEMNGSNTLSMGRLPEPLAHYRCASYFNKVFTRFGKSRILCSNAEGCTSIYDDETNSFLNMPRLNSPKGYRYVAVTIPRTDKHARCDFMLNPDVDSSVFVGQPHGDHTNSLYILDLVSGCDKSCSFEMLAYYHSIKSWCWRLLPPPPFVNDPEYVTPKKNSIAVVDGTTICLSTNTATYTFDTVALQWNKVGDWVLPFLAKAEFDTELGMWFGLASDSPYNLCALDLSDVGSRGTTPPVVHSVGLDFNPHNDVNPHKEWLLVDVALTNLGSSRFCISKFFNIWNDKDGYESHVVVCTGVEVEPSNGERPLHMIKHRSECFDTSCIRGLL